MTPEATITAPDYAGESLAAVLPAAAAAIGFDLDWAGGSGQRARELLGLGSYRRICVVLVDGLGLHQLQASADLAPSLATWPVRRIRSAFPSTTVAGLATLGTGFGPGRTGMAGYSLKLPGESAVHNLIQWNIGLQPEDWQQEPTIFEKLNAQGCTVLSVGPSRYAHSLLSRAVLRGADTVTANRPAQRIETVGQLMARSSPGLIYLYWGELDQAGHRYGWRSWQWRQELTVLNRNLRQLRRKLPADTALIVTADHGMIDVDDAPRWDLATDSDLAADVDHVGGEPRAVQLYCAPSAAGRLAARWQARLGEHAVVLRREQAVQSGLYGPMLDRIRPALGEVLVTMTGRATVVDSRVHSASLVAMVGHHGSFTDAESDIPFILVEG